MTESTNTGDGGACKAAEDRESYEGLQAERAARDILHASRERLEGVIAEQSGELKELSERLLREESQRRQADRIVAAMHRLAHATITTENSLAFMRRCHEVVAELLPAGNFFIALHDEAEDRLDFPYWTDEQDESMPGRPFGNGLTEYVVRTGEPQLVDSERYQELLAEGHIESYGTPPTHWLGVPFKTKGGTTSGVLAVQAYDGEPYTPDDVVVLTHITGQIAVAMDHVRAEEALGRSETKFRTIFEKAAIGIAIVDLDGRILDINDTGLEIIGHDREDLSGISFTDYNHPDDALATKLLYEEMAKGRRDSFHLEKRYIRKSGDMVWGRQVVSLVRDADETPLYAVSMLEDISERKRSEEMLLHRVFHDGLTDLPNRTMLHERLREALERGNNEGAAPFCVLLLDVDRFKLVNESLGHELGDRLLGDLGQRLAGELGSGDTLARLGGDEFAILLAEQDAVHGKRFAEHLLGLLKKPFQLDGRDVFISASVGLVTDAGSYDDAAGILRDADIAMYRAKERGGDGYEVFDRPMRQAAKHIFQTEAGLRKALERDELVVHYQPVVDVLTSRATGFEALVRWNHPERGMVPPAEFIPVAEETGLIRDIDLWVMRTAAHQLARWREGRPEAADVTVSVNLSSKDFYAGDLERYVLDLLAETALPSKRLSLEITESLFLGGGAGVLQQLEALRQLGARLVLDDFGTGYSSLNYLHRFPLDVLKIDRSFVQDMAKRGRSYSIVQSIIALAKGLGMEIVAEGAETREQVALLKYSGCRHVQGFAYARPMRAEEAGPLAGREVHLG